MPLRKSKAEIEDIASRLSFEQRKLVNETIRACGCPCHLPLENGNGLLSEFIGCCQFSFLPLLDLPCPHGCGHDVKEQRDEYYPSKVGTELGYCTACRRSLSAPPEIIIPEEVDTEDYSEEAEAHRLSLGDPMVQRKLSWCWEWWGPKDHRMRCRLPKGHEGDHDTHAIRRENSMIVATDGQVIS